MASSVDRLKLRVRRWTYQLPTSIKLLAIIGVALLPLGIIALLVSIQTSRQADYRRGVELRMVSNELARKLGTAISDDIATLQLSADAMSAGENLGEVCEHTRIILLNRPPDEIGFTLYDDEGRLACASANGAPTRLTTAPTNRQQFSLGTDFLELSVLARHGRAVGMVKYPRQTLAQFLAIVDPGNDIGLSLSDSHNAMTISSIARPSLLARQSVTEPVLPGLSLIAQTNRRTFGFVSVMLAFLPLLMWAAAALVAFFVADRLIVRPLHRLQSEVVHLTPGQQFRIDPINTPASEIRDLAQKIQRFGAAAQEHERSLALALDHQRKLTREVHHRVKNNLQVIASLVNLHARGAIGDVAHAYASIQRRIEALSIVHRNHFAEPETNQGVYLKTLLGELATGLRASAAQLGETPTIVVGDTQARVTQDVAVSIAFLTTELVEMALTINSSAAIAVTVLADADDPAAATLSVVSTALAVSDRLNALLDTRYGRIIEGIARQFRASLLHDPAGQYSIRFVTVTSDEQKKS